MTTHKAYVSYIIQTMTRKVADAPAQEKVKSSNQSLVVSAIENLVDQASKLHATNIHIEPRDRYIIVRYRIGNDLRVGTKLPLSEFEELVRSSKTLARLDPEETKRPQEGNFNLNVNGQQHNISLSTIPLLNGEKVLFSLHSAALSAPSLEGLGYWGDSLETVKLSLSKHSGLIVIASNGRGANAMTLLCIAHYLNNPALSVGSIEDPIIYSIPHVTQMEISSHGPTYTQAMQRLVNQGANALLLSNLPDRRSASAAMRQAKKILVCASINSNSALSALRQFNKIGSSPEITMSNFNLVVGQTLVKKLCVSCRESFMPSAAQLKQMQKLVSSFSFSKLNKLEALASEAGLGSDLKNLGTTKTSVQRLWRASKRGCPECEHSGYFGYIMTTETVDMTSPSIKSQIIKPLALEQLKTLAVKSGTIPQPTDGLIKCARGLIDFNDVVNLTT